MTNECNCISYLHGGDCVHTVSPEDFHPTHEEMIADGWMLCFGRYVHPDYMGINDHPADNRPSDILF